MTRRPDEPRFARLRSGDMAQCNDDEVPPHLRVVIIGCFLSAALGFASGFVTGYEVNDVPPHYEAPRGYDICKEKGC